MDSIKYPIVWFPFFSHLNVFSLELNSLFLYPLMGLIKPDAGTMTAMTAMTAIFITHFIMRSIFASLSQVSGIIYPLRIANMFTLKINLNELMIHGIVISDLSSRYHVPLCVI